MTSNKTLKYVKSFIVFLCLFIGKHGASTVVKRIDFMQAVSLASFSFKIVCINEKKLFAMVLDSLLIPNAAKVNGKIERKIVCIGLIKLVTESPEILNEYNTFWPRILQTVLTVIELPEDETATQGDFAHDEDEEHEHTFTNAAFTPLSYLHPLFVPIILDHLKICYQD